MKRNLLVVSLIFILCLTGCAKLVNTEYKQVKVKITNSYHRNAYSTPMYINKQIRMQYHPAIYRITVSYDTNEYNISGSSIYEKYKDKIGDTAIGTLEIKYYDDESIKYSIVSLE